MRGPLQSRSHAVLGGASVALVAACGLLVGLRSIAAWDVGRTGSLLTLNQVPHESLGISWSMFATWPASLQETALHRLTAVIVGLFGAALTVAVLNTVVLLVEAAASRSREVAARAAVGATPRALVTLLLADTNRLLTLGVTCGLLLGLSAGIAMRSTWPGGLMAVGGVQALGSIAVGLAVIAGLAALAYAWIGGTLGSKRAIALELGAGERATDDPAAVFRRRALSAIQMGAAGSIALLTVPLWLAVRGPTQSGAPPSETDVISVSAPDLETSMTARSAEAAVTQWKVLLARLAAIPGVKAESLASAGSVIGLGVRDLDLVKCPFCRLPLQGTMVDHYSVSPEYFEMAGQQVIAGRPFLIDDVGSGARPAVVNESFVQLAFAGHDPVGHLVRVGHDFDAWYRIIGVVADHEGSVVGQESISRPAVYVSAFQQPLRRADILLQGEPNALQVAVRLLAAGGYEPAESRSLNAVRAAAAAPLTWVGRIAVILSVVTLLLTIHGAHATALQIARRRTRELAIRRALGASDRRIFLSVIIGSVRSASWGAALAIFMGLIGIAVLEEAMAGVPYFGPVPYLLFTGVVVGVSVLATTQAVHEAMMVVPGEVVR